MTTQEIQSFIEDAEKKGVHRAQAIIFLNKKGVQVPSEIIRPKSGVEKVVGGINKAVEGYQNFAPIKYASKAVGTAVGALGAATGAFTGALGENARQSYNLVTGKGFDLGKMKDSAIAGAKSSAQFGAGIGESGTKAASLGALGKIPSAIIAAPQLYEGANEVYRGIKEGNTKEGLTGAAKLVGGAIGVKGAISTKGLLINKAMTAPIKTAIGKKLEPSLIAKQTKNYEDLLNMTKTQRLSEGQWGKNTPKFLAENGIEVPNNGGKIDATPAIDTIQSAYSKEAPVMSNIMKESNRYISLREWHSKMKSIFDTPANRKNSDFASVMKSIDDEYAAVLENNKGMEGFVNYGDDVLVRADQFNDIKSSQWGKAFVPKNAPSPDKLKADTHFLAGKASQELIETHFKDVADIKTMNKRLGNMASAMKILADRDGMVYRGGGLMSRGLTRVAGAVAGASGGPLGAIGGALTAEKIAQYISNPNTKIALIKPFLAEVKKNKNGEALTNQAYAIIEKMKAKDLAVKRLPAPSTIIPKAPAQKMPVQPTQAEIIANNPMLKAYHDKFIPESVRQKFIIDLSKKPTTVKQMNDAMKAIEEHNALMTKSKIKNTTALTKYPGALDLRQPKP